jgi:hypothetical protein
MHVVQLMRSVFGVQNLRILPKAHGSLSSGDYIAEVQDTGIKHAQGPRLSFQDRRTHDSPFEKRSVWASGIAQSQGGAFELFETSLRSIDTAPFPRPPGNHDKLGVSALGFSPPLKG